MFGRQNLSLTQHLPAQSLWQKKDIWKVVAYVGTGNVLYCASTITVLCGASTSTVLLRGTVAEY